MTTETLLLSIGRALALALGGLISAIALTAYWRNKARLMLYVGASFGLIASGSFVEIILYDVANLALSVAHTIESIFVMAGLSIIALMLRPRRGVA